MSIEKNADAKPKGVAAKRKPQKKPPAHIPTAEPQPQPQPDPMDVLAQMESDVPDPEEAMKVYEHAKGTPNYEELVRLHKLKKMRQAREIYIKGTQPFEAPVYTCDSCQDRITGMRWRCADCPGGKEVDLCHHCYQTFTNDVHTLEHRLVKHNTPDTYMDSDYFDANNDMAYLDPQYMAV